MKTKIYEFKKDGFRKGEYSIYLREHENNLLIYEHYAFGVSRKADAIQACAYLNKALGGTK